MATLIVTRWREDAVGFTAWDDNAKSEFARRLKRSIDASPKRLKLIERDVHARQLVTLQGVKESEIARVRQILETMGAEVELRPDDAL